MRKDLKKIADDEDWKMSVGGLKQALGIVLDNLEEVDRRGDVLYDAGQAYRVMFKAAKLYLTKAELKHFERRYNKIIGIER